MVEKDFDTTIRETGEEWPWREVLGIKSTVFGVGYWIVQIERTESRPEVIRMRESTKAAAEI